jgi:hypothetical protein
MFKFTEFQNVSTNSSIACKRMGFVISVSMGHALKVSKFVSVDGIIKMIWRALSIWNIFEKMKFTQLI